MLVLMRHRTLPLVLRLALSFLPLLVLLTGCGGAGGSSADPDAASVTLRADRTTIRPGETATLSWSSRNADEVATSNLGVTTVNGSLAVSPTFTTEYTVTVAGNGRSTSRVTVVVDRPRPRFALIGSTSDPEVPAIQSLLSGVGTVYVRSAIPVFDSFDGLVIHGSAPVGPADAATVQSALAANKGVVLVGFAPSKLATGQGGFTNDGSDTDEELDTSAIAGWFGATRLNRRIGLSDYDTAVRLSYFALPSSVDPTQRFYEPGGGDDSELPSVENGLIGATSYRTIENGFHALGFASALPSGGRVYWQWHSSGFDAPSQANVSALFRQACLWAASP